MPDKAQLIFSKFDTLVRAGEIAGFSISFRDYGLLVLSENEKVEESVFLESEITASLRSYFQDINCIRNDSSDYSSLKSFLNAKTILDRMLHHGDSPATPLQDPNAPKL
ncbi:hypothetical protein [Pontibacter beigongshangensis]|uniref:hypothetical protein n=1 Tax=Pontibacter beigongshangensis TaxID=2574733 RepID=UPI0016503424|nr:hypothetical protein [Pontibacter beigongshangensis]